MSSKKLKIAMIGHKRIPSREGGVERVVEELGIRLVNKNHIVDVYNRKGNHVSGNQFNECNNENNKYYRGIRIITIPTFQGGSLNAVVYSFIASIRAVFGKYDVIHYHAEGPCSMLWIPHIFGIRTVATIHGLDWKRSKWNKFASEFIKFGERVAVKYADEIIVLSKNNRDYFNNAYNRDVKFIPNGIYKPLVRGGDIIENKYGIKKNEYILFLARIVPEKGLHYLLDAYKNIRTSKKLVIAGGSSHTDKYMKEIKDKAKNDKRIIMTGFVQGKELEELYSNAYIYVLPSDVEGMPISLLEAMSYGQCCLVSNIDENIEVIGDNGISFNKGSSSDLSKKLEWLINNPDIVDNYKNKSSDYICNKYNWNEIVEQTIKLYKK